MNKVLENLLLMQEYEDKITDKESVINVLPQKLENLINNSKIAKEEKEKIDEQIKDNLLSQKKIEKSIADNDSIIQKHNDQLSKANTNKEYKALQSEISYCKKKNDELTEKNLILLDNEENLKKKAKEKEEEYSKAMQELQGKEDEIKTKIVEIDKEIQNLKEEEKNFFENIPVPIQRKFTALIKNKNKKAVAINNNGVCSVCGFKIRQQLLLDLNRKEEIIYCENCGRIIAK